MGARSTLVVLSLLVAVAASAPLQAQDVDDLHGRLLVADWHGALLGRALTGRVGVIMGADGSVRAEVTTDVEANLGKLLDRRGSGWTVVLAAGGDGVLQPWDRQWQRLAADLATAAAVVAGRLYEPPVDAGSERVVVAAVGGTRRAELVVRGRGRGGPGEILSFVWEPGVGRQLTASSSRRPGSLRFSGLQCFAVEYPAVETFVPLWPLADLLVIPSKIPGTCAPSGG